MNAFLFSTAVFVVACQVVLGADPAFDDHWKQFKNNHNKSYEHPAHEESRRVNFEAHMKSVIAHNARHELGLESYAKSANHQHADLSYEEFVRTRMGVKFPFDGDYIRNVTPIVTVRARPTSVDYRGSNRVTSVKDQQTCGSCWTFSTAAAIEGQLAKVGLNTVDISEQQLLDCAKEDAYGCAGCDGGWPQNALQYVKDIGGIQTAAAYSYQNEAQDCKEGNSAFYVSVKSYSNVAANENAVADAIYAKGPLTVAIHVNDNLMNYKSGIFEDASCPKDVNHAVTLVGYGTEKGKDYWIVKNSWGPNWGERGYIRMRRNKNNMCAIASHAAYPELQAVK